MTGTLCLQGGAEFQPACRAMDALLLEAAGGGPVVVSALAGRPGADYATATANGVRHFTALGAVAVAAPDAREDPAGAAAALAGAALLVLPGGSPSRLRAALTGTPAGAAVRDVLRSGGVVMGASAGAMLLCAWTLLPEEGDAEGPALAPGLGAVPGALVLPHFDAARPGSWPTAARRRLDAVGASDTVLLGLPECSGVLVVPEPEAGAAGGVPEAPAGTRPAPRWRLTAVGAEPTTLLHPDGTVTTLDVGCTTPTTPTTPSTTATTPTAAPTVPADTAARRPQEQQ